MLAGAPLAVVGSRHHHAASIGLGPVDEVRVHVPEDELGYGRDVGPQGQYLRPRRQDVVGGDVVSQLDQDYTFLVVLEGASGGQRLDVRATADLYLTGVLRGGDDAAIRRPGTGPALAPWEICPGREGSVILPVMAVAAHTAGLAR